MPPLAASAPIDAQLDFLAWLHWMWAGFNTVIGVVMGASAIAVAILAGTGPAAADVAAGVTAGAFFFVALAAFTWGGAHAWCGRALLRRQRWGRIAALAFALFNAPLFPLGTLLAGYTAWLLLQGAGRERFEALA
ncbi:MAG TPA: hypothetical protein VNK41_09760 [Vicinamibacterales bacterium]|nr:hypothetical protein [Vicinamibacterales bacterium]